MGLGCIKSKVLTKGGMVQDDVADQLVHKGFTVRQLLEFYDFHKKSDEIVMGTTTNEVVRNIIILATSSKRCCYMESEFMIARGGGQKTRRLVSHAWKSEFVNTVLNIVLDATEWSTIRLMNSNISEGEIFYENGVLQADLLLDKMEPYMLAKTYWLCIFAVNEHRAICGDCWECNKTQRWKAEPMGHLRADPCLICGKHKFNPCSCGSLKYEADDQRYEINKFDLVVQQMEAPVVSLDTDMNSIKRVWVVAEIGKAIVSCNVFFRLAMGLAPKNLEKLAKRETLMETVEACDSTSPVDRERILTEIRSIEGGISAFDQFINCMLELSFGVCFRLETIKGNGAHVIGRLRQLEMDCHWKRESIQSATELMGDGSCLSRLKQLQQLHIHFHACPQLVDVRSLGNGLGKLSNLRQFNIDFSLCSGIGDVRPLGDGLGKLTNLIQLEIDFTLCTSIKDIRSFGNGIGKASNLQVVNIDFHWCSNISGISSLGNGFGKLTNLQRLSIDFYGCRRINDISSLGKGLGRLRNVTHLHLDFTHCMGISNIGTLGDSLGKLMNLQHLNIDFSRCTSIGDISSLGDGLGKLEKLQYINIGFSACPNISDISCLGSDLGKLRSLQHVNIDFSYCSSINDVSSSEYGLSKLTLLHDINIDFRGCPRVSGMSALGNSMGKLRDLQHVCIDGRSLCRL